MSAKRGIRSDEAGSSGLQFALLAPAFFVLVLGIVQLGWALHCGASVRWALESSARTLVTNPDMTQGQLRSAMLARLGDVTGADTLSVTLVTDSANPDAPVARATAAYIYRLTIPFVPTYDLNFTASTAVPVPPA